MEHQFYMVYVEGSGSPTVKHSTRTLANQEAERLSRNNPGQEVYVLKAVQKTVATGGYTQELNPREQGPAPKTSFTIKQSPSLNTIEVRGAWVGSQFIPY